VELEKWNGAETYRGDAGPYGCHWQPEPRFRVSKVRIQPGLKRNLPCLSAGKHPVSQGEKTEEASRADRVVPDFPPWLQRPTRRWRPCLQPSTTISSLAPSFGQLFFQNLW